MKILIKVMVILGLLMAFTTVVFADEPPLRERVWYNHEEYEIIEGPTVSGDQPANPYYIIGAIDENNPQGPGHEGALGPHDHVIPVIPPQNEGEFTPLWRITLVLPGPNAVLFGPQANVLVRFVSPPDPPNGPLPLVYAAVLPGQGAGPHSLQSAAELEQAKDLGLVTFVDTGFVFVGPVVGKK